jgi:hypothetical protein
MKKLERNLPSEHLKVYNTLKTANSKIHKLKSSRSSFSSNDNSTIRMIQSKISKRNSKLCRRNNSEPFVLEAEPNLNPNELSLTSSDSEEQGDGDSGKVLVDLLIANGSENCFILLQELDELKRLFEDLDNAKYRSNSNANSKQNAADIEAEIFEKEETMWRLYFNDNAPFQFDAPKKFWPRDSVRMKLGNYNKIKFWTTEKIRTYDDTFLAVKSGVVIRGKSNSLRSRIRRIGLKFDQ